jgi:hypothetical protein
MISSFFMLFSQYNKNARLASICAVAWIVNMLYNSNFHLDLFSQVNLMTFLMVTLFVRKIKNKHLHMVGAISSILLYSVCIDVICYFLYPQLVSNQNLLGYVWSGLAFNSKYLFSNGLALGFGLMLKKLALECRKIHMNIFQLSNIKL